MRYTKIRKRDSDREVFYFIYKVWKKNKFNKNVNKYRYFYNQMKRIYFLNIINYIFY